MVTNPIRPAKVVSSPPQVRPPYEPARLLQREVLDAQAIVDQARAEAARVRKEGASELEASRRHAEEVVLAAEQDAKRIRAAAAEAGRCELGMVADSLARELGSVGSLLADRVVDLSFRAAKSILRAELRVQPEVVLPLVREMLMRTRMFNRIHIILSTEDAALARGEIDRLRAISAFANDFAIREDSELPRGSVRVETETGAFDGGIETGLARLAESWGITSPGGDR